ncbi:hypothetical protein LEP1GSC051_1906 [Leptospira sp. P2653]|nr:hypothetical protein LEP1GSC051_1906 [Leptospira sp. P2653]
MAPFHSMFEIDYIIDVRNSAFNAEFMLKLTILYFIEISRIF